tara:strand:+ start:5631 stop:5768 length:138 start_codon:yes stop_codon:yes gene_type:complete
MKKGKTKIEDKLKRLGFKKSKPDKDGFVMFSFSPADLIKKKKGKK